KPNRKPLHDGRLDWVINAHCTTRNTGRLDWGFNTCSTTHTPHIKHDGEPYSPAQIIVAELNHKPSSSDFLHRTSTSATKQPQPKKRRRCHRCRARLHPPQRSSSDFTTAPASKQARHRQQGIRTHCELRLEPQGVRTNAQRSPPRPKPESCGMTSLPSITDPTVSSSDFDRETQAWGSGAREEGSSSKEARPQPKQR
ncbi:hypothetical protein U9M48_025466, partial [Paspalum notatum var. saurae]